MRMTRSTAVAAAIAVSAFWTTAASAQSSPPNPQQQQMPPTAAQSFSQNEIKKYAQASLAIQQVSMNFEPQIKNAPSTNQQRALQSQAQQQMVQAVREQGLTVRKFNEIAQASRANPELAKQIQKFATQAK